MRIQDVRTNIRNDLIMNDTLLLMPILTTTNPRDPSMLQCWIAAFVGQPQPLPTEVFPVEQAQSEGLLAWPGATAPRTSYLSHWIL
jgi:hypothetical protein